MGERASSPDEEIILSANNAEHLGPSEEAEAEFAKELAKLVTDTAESRKVDKKTALALWDSAVLPPTARKKKPAEDDDEGGDDKDTEGGGVMTFTVITKRGNRQLVSEIRFISVGAKILMATKDSPTCCTGRFCYGCSHPECTITRQS